MANYYTHGLGKGGYQKLLNFRRKLLLAIAHHQYGYPLADESHISDIRNCFWKVIAKVFSRKFNRFPPKPEGDKVVRSLDIGCGSGDYVCLMQEIGWEAWGIEPDPRAVNVARNKGCKHILQGSLEDFTFDAGSFDLVTLWDSLEHTYSPVSLLRKVKQVLKPGGIVYIKVPNPECLEAKIWKEDWIGYDLPRHLYHFHPEVLKKIVIDCGFDIVDFQFVSPPNMVANGVITGLSHKIRGLNFLYKLSTLLTIMFLPHGWLLDWFGSGNTYQVFGKRRSEEFLV